MFIKVSFDLKGLLFVSLPVRVERGKTTSVM